MTNTGDIELLRQYERQGSEAAFATVVQRHVNLVFSVAWRHVGIAAHAEEITQAVFVILARKCGGLRDDTVLEGWLCNTARLTALSFLRGERRRQFREQEAYMQSTLQEPETDSVWNRLAPLLDEGLSHLGKTDRDALVLRFFKQQSMREIAAALNVKEPAAQRRVLRAVEKLRKFFTKRGVVLSATALTTAIAANSVQAAPAMLATTATAVAVAKGATSGSSTLTLIKGALKLMAWTKAKTAIIASVGILLAAGTTTVVVQKVVFPKFSGNDTSWADNPRYWELNSSVLEKNPPAFILRKAKLPGRGGSIQVGDKSRYMMLFVNSTLENLLCAAYGANEVHTIMPEGLPDDHYDLMLTKPGPAMQMIQDKIKQEFGVTAHFEQRETDVYYLRKSDSPSPGLSPSKGDNQRWSSRSGGNFNEQSLTDIPFAIMLGFIEGSLKRPVIDQTGLKGKYDVHLKWPVADDDAKVEVFKQALLDQLGLEIVSGREKVGMLVVEHSDAAQTGK